MSGNVAGAEPVEGWMMLDVEVVALASSERWLCMKPKSIELA